MTSWKLWLLNIIPIAITIANYTIGTNQWPNAKTWIELVVVILTAILNSIGGINTSVKLKNAKLKLTNAKLQLKARK